VDQVSWPARYTGWCASCKERIEIDDSIKFVAPDDRRVVHDDCGGTGIATPPIEHEVCTTCWLTHPPGACDR
jgi:hypothetical protein